MSEPARRVAAKAPPKPQTATEKLQALAERRHAGRGYLVPRPVGLTLQSFRAWLKEVAEIGGAGDVEIAWHYVNNVEWKERLRNEYDQLRAAAGRRHNALVEQAADEERQAKLEWEARTRQIGKEREKAALRARLAVLEDE